jgi:hypothetical protein
MKSVRARSIIGWLLSLVLVMIALGSMYAKILPRSDICTGENPVTCAQHLNCQTLSIQVVKPTCYNWPYTDPPYCCPANCIRIECVPTGTPHLCPATIWRIDRDFSANPVQGDCNRFVDCADPDDPGEKCID